ncbi:hypothetical protein MCETRH20_00918 [Methylophilaceae bacterium]|jgi:hypothetical protein
MEEDVNNFCKRNISDEYHFLRLGTAEKLLLPQAEAGELWAIQNLLKLAAEALADGARLNDKVALFISKALIKIHAGEKADNAFGIARKRGGKDTRRVRERNFSIAHFIEQARTQQNITIEVAVALAASEYHLSEDTVKNAWKGNYKKARRILKLNEEYFG